VEGDDFKPAGIALIACVLVIGARGLDRGLHRLGTRIGEEHRVAKGIVDQHLRQPLTLRAAIQVRHMHQRGGLLLDRTDQPFVRVAEQVDGDAAGKIKVTRAVLVNQVAMFPAHGPHAATRIDGHERGDRHGQIPELRNNKV